WKSQSSYSPFTVHDSLFIFSMHSVAAAATTIFFELKPVRRVLFIFCRHVIPLFALGALQNYVISRHINFNCQLSVLAYLATTTVTDDCFVLFHDLADSTGTDGSSAFADSETEPFFHGDRGDQLDLHSDVVARHHHLDSLWQVCHTCYVRCSEVEL